MPNACSMFDFQQLNVAFIHKMGYIAVDTSHFILVLFCFVAYSKPIPIVVMVLEILRYSTIDNLTMPFCIF